MGNDSTVYMGNDSIVFICHMHDVKVSSKIKLNSNYNKVKQY